MVEFDDSAKKQVKSTSLVDKGIKKLAATVGGLALAYKGLDFGKKSIELFKVQDKANRLVKASFGEASGEMRSFADELQILTNVGDESTLLYAGMVKNMGLTVEQTQDFPTNRVL